MNTITFGSITSSTYGIYISGEGVWNAPERDAEVIEIPGRNGAFIRDYGNFKNIQVTYRVFNQEASYSDFRTKIDNFRNALASQKGYQKLTDTFHPDEYRMAAFIGGMEVKPIMINDKASEFEITFECKPQRFKLIYDQQTGLYKEEVDPISSGSTINNATLFDSHPLMEFTASSGGTISLGTQTITFLNSPVGYVQLNLTKSTATVTGYDPVDALTIGNTSVWNNNDIITVRGGKLLAVLKCTGGTFTQAQITASNGLSGSVRTDTTKKVARVELISSEATFSAGTGSTVTQTATLTTKIGTTTANTTLTLAIYYNGSNTIQYRWQLSSITNTSWNSKKTDESNYEASVDSTKNAISGTLYVDLDIGEAYKVDSGVYVSLNNFFNLGGELPVLPPGNTTITYSNSISNFKITPRWWTV